MNGLESGFLFYPKKIANASKKRKAKATFQCQCTNQIIS